MRRPNYARAAALWLGPCLALACAAAWGARGVRDGVLQDGVPPASATSGAGLEKFSIDSEARILDWSSDGALLVAVHEAGVEQMRRLSGAPPQGEARSLGAPDSMLLSASAQLFSSDWIAYLGDDTGPAGAAGAALNLRAPSGSTKTLLPAAARPGAPAWAHDGRRLAFSAALRDPKSTDLYVLDTAGAAGPRLLASGNADARQALAWTGADKSLLVRHSAPVTGDELLLVDVETGAARHLAPAPGAPAGYVHIGEVRLAPGERGVYFVSDRGGARNGLHYVDLYDHSTQEVPGAAGHDIEHFDVSADNRSIALSWTEFGYSRIAILDRQNNGLTVLPNIPAGAVTALRFDRAGTRLAFELASSVTPRDVYVCQLADRSCARWTASRLGEYTAARLVAPLTVRFPTWDRPTGSGSALTAFLYRPRTPGPHPVLIILGGGGAAPSAMLDPFVQYCVNELGIAVIAPGLRDGEPGVLDLGALVRPGWVPSPTCAATASWCRAAASAARWRLPALVCTATACARRWTWTAWLPASSSCRSATRCCCCVASTLRRWMPLPPSNCCGGCARPRSRAGSWRRATAASRSPASRNAPPRGA